MQIKMKNLNSPKTIKEIELTCQKENSQMASLLKYIKYLRKK